MSGVEKAAPEDPLSPGWLQRTANRVRAEVTELERTKDALRSAQSANAELLRLLERHHKESLARDILLPEDAEHYSGTELYWATVGATRPAEAAIERAKEKA